MPDFKAQFVGSTDAGPPGHLVAWLRVHDAPEAQRYAAMRRAADRATWCLHHIRVAAAYRRAKANQGGQ